MAVLHTTQFLSDSPTVAMIPGSAIALCHRRRFHRTEPARSPLLAARALRALSQMLILILALAGCKPAVVTKGSGEASEPLVVPGSNGPRVRTALVIGNSRYEKLQRLEACKHDAEVMAETFRKIGIPLYGGKPLFDLTTDQMDTAIGS